MVSAANLVSAMSVLTVFVLPDRFPLSPKFLSIDLRIKFENLRPGFSIRLFAIFKASGR